MMTETLSFLNWGFPPSTATGRFYLLTGGGGSHESMDIWSNHQASKDFKTIFSELYRWVWGEYDFMKEYAYEYIEEDGAYLTAHHTTIGKLQTAFSIPIWGADGKYLRSEKVTLPNISPKSLLYLKKTLPYDSARWGDLIGEPRWGEYFADSKQAFLDEFDKEYLTTYLRELEAIKDIDGGNRLMSLTLISPEYYSEEMGNRMSVSYLI